MPRPRGEVSAPVVGNLEVDHGGVVREAAGVGVARLTRFLVAEAIAVGALVERLTELGLAALGYTSCTHGRAAPLPKVRAFAEPMGAAPRERLRGLNRAYPPAEPEGRERGEPAVSVEQVGARTFDPAAWLARRRARAFDDATRHKPPCAQPAGPRVRTLDKPARPERPRIDLERASARPESIRTEAEKKRPRHVDFSSEGAESEAGARVYL